MSSNRIAWFDNAKGILIFLVVFGHSIETYRNSGSHHIILTVYNIIYTFHMPLFILISGYFYREGKFKRTIQLMSIFVIWQVINGILTPLIDTHKLVSIKPGSRWLNILDPYWTLWFLIGMIFWRICTPYIVKLKFPLIIVIVFSIWISYIDHVTGWFSIRKIINFYPYFIIGYLLAEKGTLMKLSHYAQSWSQSLRWVALTIVAGFVGSMIYMTGHGFNTDLLFMRDSFGHFHWSLFKGATVYIFMYTTVTVLSISIMLLIPQNKKLPYFNKLGFYSLYIFLIHANFIRLYRQLMPHVIAHNVLFVLSIACIVAYTLGLFIVSTTIRSLFQPLIEPDLNWLIRATESKTKSKQIISQS